MAGVIEVEGLQFRDLDHDGQLAAYEDWRLSPAVRARDLVSRLTLAEKVGLMLHGTAQALGGPLARLGMGQEYDADAMRALIQDRKITHFITRLSLPAPELAREHNRLQEIAAAGRLGIPLTISTDPRHHFREVAGASVSVFDFSQWPDALGLAATGDVDLVRRFGNVVRQEYRAVGIHMALSPQADLATQPQWPRILGTFGQDPDFVGRCVTAYVEGVQGGADGVRPNGVAAVVKHWVGYGAARDGFDGHNHYGRFSAFPGGAFADHVNAFLGAFAAGVAGVMPTYNILEDLEIDGRAVEPAGAGFSRVLLEGLLRGAHGYDGVILSDWGIMSDCNESCRTGVPPQTPADLGMPWGVEDLSQVARLAKGVAAGLDQIGGLDDPAPLLEAVAQGLVDEARLDRSAFRILRQKFELGLFDNPFVDADAAGDIVGCAAFRAGGVEAQRRSVTVLKRSGQGALLPPGASIHLQGVNPAAAKAAGFRIADSPDKADIALMRLGAPFQSDLHPGFFFAARQHEGDLDFKDGAPDYEAFKRIAAACPTLAVIHLDRPAIVGPILARAQAVVGVYGLTDEALLAALSDPDPPRGRLPFALPRDMAAVRAQAPDRPTDDPAYPVFFSAAR